MVYTLQNIIAAIKIYNPVVKQRIIIGETRSKQYNLVNALEIQLSNNDVINIPKGFEWDLSSAPRLLWPILPPDGDFEMAALIHDYLYTAKTHSRKFADKEMLVWSRVLNDKHIDNNIRYIGVRLFGRLMW